MKCCILCAAHCDPKVLKTTIGTWLDTYDQSYEAELYVGLHSNYSDYHPGLGELLGMIPYVKFVRVKEIDWNAPRTPLETTYRYSEMHARSLLTIMTAMRKDCKNFTHVAILDHDLIFYKDFIGWAMRTKADLVGSLFEDRSIDRELETEIAGSIVSAPRVSVWHMVLSKKLFDAIKDISTMVKNHLYKGRVFDVMAMTYEIAKMVGMNVRIEPEETIARLVRHLGSMSFNFSKIVHSLDSYNANMRVCESEYARRFPNGIDRLLRKLV